MDNTQIDPQIAVLLEKAQKTGLSAHDRSILNGYIMSSRGQVPAEFTSYLMELVDAAPETRTDLGEGAGSFGWNADWYHPGPGTLSDPTSGSPWDALQDVSQFPESGPSVQKKMLAEAAPTAAPLPTGENWKAIAQGLPGSSIGFGGPAATDLPTAAPGSSPSVATKSPLLSDETKSLGLSDDPAVDRELRQANRRDRTTSLDRAAKALMGLEKRSLDPDSAFAGLSNDYLAGVAHDPAMAARFIAEHQMGDVEGGNSAAAAAIMTPRMQQALNLDMTGILGGRHKLEGARSDAERLQAAEALMTGVGAGEYLDPQALYRQTFKNALNTPVGEMDTGEGGAQAGDPANQMAVTNGALMAAAQASMTAESQEGLSNKLDAAAQEYMMGVASGDIDPNLVSYPEFLRTTKKARRWVGPGLSLEQARAAF